LEVVRARFAQSVPVTDQQPLPSPDVIADWIGSKEADGRRLEDRRFRIVRRWTIIAAVASIAAAVAGGIAAWPIIKEWLPLH
jgi:hypothetical protein